MKKAASAFLRMEICHADITRMIRWMRNPNVTRYLNEAPTWRSRWNSLCGLCPNRCTNII